MKQRLKKIISNFLVFIIINTTILAFFSVKRVSALDESNSGLIEKISSDFTKKFCNSIGFGLSKESAMNFSYSENKQIFIKRQGFEDINKVLLADKIALSVIDGCGYQLNLYGENDIKEFANYYLSIDQENS
tara:strand:- start:133 stop:528 length:396 start_codon:yes stop_codon:yes gene_type:complete